MAFCKYCGKELKEGERCDCQVSSAPKTVEGSQTEPAAEAVEGSQTAAAEAAEAPQRSGVTVNLSVPDKEIVAAASRKVLNRFVSIIKKPATEGTAFVAKGDSTVSLCLIVIQACFSAIFSMCVISKINGLINLGGSFLRNYKFSMAKAFFITILFSILFSALLILLFRVATLIMKAKTSWRQLMTLVAVRSIALLPLILVGCVFFLINPAVGIVIFYCSGLLGLCFMLSAIRGIEGMYNDRAVYIVFAVTIVFMLISSFIASKAVILYLPDALRDLMEGNWLSLLEQFF